MADGVAAVEQIYPKILQEMLRVLRDDGRAGENSTLQSIAGGLNTHIVLDMCC